MREHLTIEELQRWRNGELPPADVISIGRHLAECADCAAGPAATAARPAIAAMRDWLDLAAAEHVGDEELALFAAHALPADRTAEVEAHLAVCEVCREEVTPPPVRRIPRPMAFAAAAAAIVIGVFLARDDAPPDVVPPAPEIAVPVATSTVAPPPPRYADPAWARLMENIELTKPAVLAELRPPKDALRGEHVSTTASRFTPAGAVVESSRPRFTWPATSGASYVVSIFDRDEEIAHSPRLSQATWTPARDLPRGRTYTWQVEMTPPGGKPTILPAPPAPPAMFRLLDAASASELHRARATHPDDHLLLGVLYARAGLTAEATRELARAKGPEAERLLREVREW